MLKLPLISLHKKGHVVGNYINDLFLLAKTHDLCVPSGEDTFTQFDSLGFKEGTVGDNIQEDAIADNREEVPALGATSTMQDITKQFKLILSKLEGLESKLETAIETVS